MNYRQIRILVTLATDAKDLKVGNGWYGDPRQGDSTLEEDEAAIVALDAMGEVMLHEAEAAKLRSQVALVNVFIEALGNVNKAGLITTEQSRVATNFFGHAQDGDLEGMGRSVDELAATLQKAGQ